MLDSLLFPATWLVRRISLGGKLVLLLLLCLGPMVAAGLMQLLGIAATGPMLYVTVICAVLALYLAAAFYVEMSAGLQQVRTAMEHVIQGNLCFKPAIDGHDECSVLLQTTGRISSTISAMVANVRSNAAFVAHAGKSMSSGNRELSDRTEQQAANLEQTAASVEELSSTVNDNARMAGQVNTQAASLRDVAEHGVASMTQAISSVEVIQSSAKRMDEIVGVIDGLAFQTNILALNAAVEAARAGESGRGFAVVASEVRSLAQRSADSAKEIRQLIGASSAQVASSVQSIRQAGGQITQIVSGIRDVAAKMAQISASSAEQSSGLTEITSAVRQLDEITQRNAQMVEQAVAQAANLEHRAQTLVEGFASFKLQQGTPEEAIDLVMRAMQRWPGSAGRQSFVRDITDPAQRFFDRDMYVFVLDRRGTYLAFGGNPAKVGTLVQDIPGIDGQGLVDDIFEQAAHEPGWVEYDILNPVTGRVQSKMSYVVSADDLAVGCGVYKNLVTV